MSFGSPKHHSKHHSKQPRVTRGSSSYPVSAGSKEPMACEWHQSWEYPKTVELYEHPQPVLEAPLMVPNKMVERVYYYPQLVKNTNPDEYRVEEDVDREADDFIKLEHKKFARLNSSMSMNWE